MLPHGKRDMEDALCAAPLEVVLAALGALNKEWGQWRTEEQRASTWARFDKRRSSTSAACASIAVACRCELMREQKC